MATRRCSTPKVIGITTWPSFAELPERSIVYHVDQGNVFKAHQVLGHKFCLSGGIPNFLLAYRPADEVRDYCKKLIDGVRGTAGTSSTRVPSCRTMPRWRTCAR